MTEQSKQLLLKDLCARLPYGVICTDLRHGDSKITEVNTEDCFIYCPDFDKYVDIENCHLYLRPMSSMTNTEEDEYMAARHKDIAEAYIHLTPQNAIDWLLAHHFDFRNLIEKGLALEAPKDMYKTE